MTNIRILFVFEEGVEGFGADIEGTLMDLAHLPMYGKQRYAALHSDR